MEIKDILLKYDTDKESHHHYGAAYNDIFKSFDRNSPLNLLEIGTQKGGSLLAWKEYFPNSKVTGLDIVDVVPEKYRMDSVTRIISDVKDWKTDETFDVVIDDGSHHLSDILYLVTHYSMKLKPKGIIVIEDVRDPELLFKAICNCMTDLKVIYPSYNGHDGFRVKIYDKRRKGAESSLLMALFKEQL